VRARRSVLKDSENCREAGFEPTPPSHPVAQSADIRPAPSSGVQIQLCSYLWRALFVPLGSSKSMIASTPAVESCDTQSRRHALEPSLGDPWASTAVLGSRKSRSFPFADACGQVDVTRRTPRRPTAYEPAAHPHHPEDVVPKGRHHVVNVVGQPGHRAEVVVPLDAPQPCAAFIRCTGRLCCGRTIEGGGAFGEECP